MQYAQIAVDTKTNLDRQTFTYSIPPQLLPDIKTGILVIVPFHGRRIQGVIVAIKQFSNLAIKNKLKPIIKIIDTNPVIDGIHLELAKWMSEYYLVPIGEVIFSMIPPVAIRSISTIELSHQLLTTNHQPQIYTFYGRVENRLKAYIKLVNKSINKNKNCLVLFPNINQARKFQSKFDKKYKSILYHSEMTKTQRYLIWNDIRAGKYQIVLGTRPTVFAPVDNLGLIIIDQPENFGYKEDQGSRYHSLKVAEKLIQFTDANLILGSLVPSVDAYYCETHRKYRKLQNNSEESKISIVKKIINLNNQKNKIISYEFQEIIKETLIKQKKILVYVQKKGDGSTVICKDCNYIFNCPNCNLPLRFNNQLLCYRCNFQKNLPTNCPNCNGVRMSSLGIGLETVKREILKIFPDSKIDIIDINTQNPENIYEKCEIIIATKKILDFPNLHFDLTGVIGLDSILNLPDFKSNENIYFTIVNLIYLTRNQLLLQTYNPENEFWNFVKKNSLLVFLQKELTERKKNNLPPYSQLIKLTYQNQSEEKCLIEIENLKSEIENLKLNFLGPSPAFITKIRGQFQYQMLIFINNATQKHYLYKIVAKLSKGWKIDIDPISLI